MSSALSVSHGAFGRAGLYRLDKALITHAHREGHLIFHVDGSYSEVVIHDETHDVNFQQGIAVSSLESHSFNIKSSEPSVVLVMYIKPIWFLENSHAADRPFRFGRSTIERTPAVDQLVSKFTTILLDSQNVGSTDTLLFNLAKVCYEQSWLDIDGTGVNRFTKSGFSDYRITRSLEMMQKCISAEVELESVARSVGLSRPHFFKLFKKQMGITPNIYMNTLRSERAIEDLINTDKTVTNIAYELGYSSQASFTRFFSSNVGIAPTEYRRVADRPECAPV